MKDIVISIFGNYTPVMTNHAVVGAEGVIHNYQVVASGLAGVDWSFVGGLLLFSIVLHGLLVIIGLIFKR